MNGGPTDGAVVIGIDGAPWSLLDRWTRSGELPTFALLRREGAAGPLESTTPASTPLAWPSIFTGTWPDKHGLYWFRSIRSDYSHRMATSRDIERPPVWTMLQPAVVANVPMTYPATETDGAVVSGMMTASRDDGFTHPPALASRIDEQVPDYEIGLDWAEYDGDAEALLADLDDVFEARTRLMELLMAEYDPRLFFFVYTAPDRLQHLVWDDDVLLAFYRKLDDALATALEYAASRSRNLFVVSDHGFGPVSTVVSTNRVLEEAGYLTRRENTGTRGVLQRAGITKESVSSLFASIGIDEASLVESLPQGFVDMASLQIPGDRVLYDMDYAETTAFFHGSGCLYVNDRERFEQGVVDPADVDRVTAELRSVLEDVCDPETGEQVLAVRDGEDLFPNDPASPELVVQGVDGYEVQTALTESVFQSAETKAAGHRSEGVLFAHGPDVAAGSVPDAATVVDVAPTVLHLSGEAVPADTDGRVLSELLASDSIAGERAVERRSYGTDRGGDAEDLPEEEEEAVERRLRGLGYLE